MSGSSLAGSDEPKIAAATPAWATTVERERERHRLAEAQPISDVLPSVLASSLSPPRPSATFEPKAETPERRRERAVAFLTECGVPRRHCEAFDSVDLAGPWGEKYASLKAARGSGFLVALLGDRGTGKTQMGARLMLAAGAVPDAEKPRYVRAMDWFIDIRRAFRPDGPSEADVLKAWYAPTLLVIDEIHLRGETAWEDRLLANLIDHRYGDMRDTLIISNLKWDAFAASVDPSIVSRLGETGGKIECNWPSFRSLPRTRPAGEPTA